MKHPAPTLFAATVLTTLASAQNPLELLVQQQTHYWFTADSYASPAQWIEAADDFDVVASIERVRAKGHVCWSCQPGDLLSARLAFYEWTPAGPGALQQVYVFQDGDAGLAYSTGPGLIDFTLSAPFAATGKHFLSVQVEASSTWSWWAANYGAPQGSPVLERTQPDGPWSGPILVNPPGPANGDLAFELYGVDATPPTAGTDPCGPWSLVATPAPKVGNGVFLHDVAALAEDEVWAVGNYNHIYAPPLGMTTLSWIQRWDGQQWSHVPSPNPEPYANGGSLALYAVAAIEPDDVWAAGSYRVQNPSGGSLGTQIFVVHWDGSSWSQVPAPMSATGSGPFVHDILVTGEDEIWFFGQWLGFELGGVGEQRSLAMHWDGSDFDVVDTPFFDNYGGYGGGHSIEAADGVAPDDIWAVGGAHGADFSPHSYIVHWDGSTWTHVPGPKPGSFNRLFAVEALASDDVWATGFYTPAAGGANLPLYLHWDGSSWTQVDAPGGGRALLHRPAAGDLISAAGVYGGQGVFRWDGTSWTPVMDFVTSANPAIVALALVPGTDCETWGVGRQNGPDVGGLTVHLDPPGVAAKVAVLEPCSGGAPPQSLLASPAPELGAQLSIAAGDPSSAAMVAPGSLVLLALGGPAAGACGALVPGFGADLAAGELLLAGPVALLPVAAWGGPEAPAVFDLAVPSQTALAGASFAAQAAFLDPADGDIVLTRGLLLTVGP